MEQLPAAAYDRLDRWIRWTRWTPMEAAYRLGCDRSYLGHLLKQRRAPGLRVAVAIERVSAAWPEGPIRAVEWVPEAEPLPATGTEG